MGTLVLISVVLFVLIAVVIVYSVEQNNQLVLAPVGTYKTQHKEYDLREYFVDKKGNLYSANLDTWEINHTKGRDLLKCSDKSFNKSGHLVNSLRDTRGIKATVARHKFNYRELKESNGFVVLDCDKTTNRHFKIKYIKDYRNIKLTSYIHSGV